MTDKFPAKDPRETVVLTFDASAELESGETLTGVSKTDVTLNYGTGPDADMADVVSGAQINAAAVTVGGKTIAIGQCVQAVATGGLSGFGYLIAITCTTSNPDKVLTLKGILPVSSQ